MAKLWFWSRGRGGWRRRWEFQWKPERRTGSQGGAVKKRKNDRIGKRLTISPLPALDAGSVVSWLMLCQRRKLPVCYHSGNVVACGEMKGRGKTDRMQIACRCVGMEMKWMADVVFLLAIQTYSHKKWPKLSKALLQIAASEASRRVSLFFLSSLFYFSHCIGVSFLFSLLISLSIFFFHPSLFFTPPPLPPRHWNGFRNEISQITIFQTTAWCLLHTRCYRSNRAIIHPPAVSYRSCCMNLAWLVRHWILFMLSVTMYDGTLMQMFGTLTCATKRDKVARFLMMKSDEGCDAVHLLGSWLTMWNLATTHVDSAEIANPSFNARLSSHLVWSSIFFLFPGKDLIFRKLQVRATLLFSRIRVALLWPCLQTLLFTSRINMRLRMPLVPPASKCLFRSIGMIFAAVVPLHLPRLSVCYPDE